MSEDQGEKKGQDSSDETVKDDDALPAEPAALSDKDLSDVAGGRLARGLPNTNDVGWAPLRGSTFKKP